MVAIFQTSNLSAWYQLIQNQITCPQAIDQLITDRNLNLDRLDPEVNSRFFRNFPDRQKLPPLVPLLLWQNCYYLASPYPLTPEMQESIGHRTQTDIQILPITEHSYRQWHHQTNVNLNQINAESLINPLSGESENENITEITEIYLAKAKDQIQRVRTIISSALRNRASDIHLEPLAEGLRVRYRIDGVLREITTLPLELSRRVVVAIKVMSNMDIAESRKPQDGRIGQKYALKDDTSELGLDMRVSTLPCVEGEKVVIRLLPQRNPFTDMNKLGFSPQTLPIYQNWIAQPQGMIILTGPTGSGKTSTLYTSLQAVSKESVNVVTVEDPVEYRLSGITQTQVNELAGMTFAAGLRSILRQDPDIIMIGEIRDGETAETAVRAALTGHLVFTTLHTNDALGAIPRLKDIGVDSGLISDALLGVIAQRLVRRICPHCIESYSPSAEELKSLGLQKNQLDLSTWKKGKGCKNCFESGYLGREAIIEVLDIDDTARELIYEGSLTQLRHYLQKIDYQSFKKSAIEKINAGITTIEEVRRVLPYSFFSSKHKTA